MQQRQQWLKTSLAGVRPAVQQQQSVAGEPCWLTDLAP
jgi:hypothetical protein